MAQVRWHLDASNDFDSIIERIAVESPSAAARLGERILSLTRQLEDFPESGRIVPELEPSRYRELIVGRYRIVYRWADDTVRILAVVPAAMELGRQATTRGWD